MRNIIILSVAFVTSMFSANAQFWSTTEPTKLKGSINSSSEESVPVFSKDSSILYFVRTFDDANKGGEQDQDIWFSKRSASNTYDQSERLTALNNKYNNAIFGLNKAGTTMYLFNAYEGKKDQVKGIAKSTYAKEKWGTPEKLNVLGLDIDGDHYGFHMSEDESTLIVSYMGPGSLGEEDLYVSTKNGDGSYSTPLHMGSAINSSGFEISPFLTSRKDTLFFSSNGFGGQGDADIFYSVRKGSLTEWSKPVNLGSKINSPKFDAYFIHSGNQAFWSSNRDSELSDIWMLTIPPVPPVSVICSSTNASKFGMKDGKIDATVSGGIAPYVYKWSNGATTEDIASLPIGEYSLTITDALGQTSQTNCAITQPAAPQDIAMKHMFGYNANKLTPEEGELQSFLSTIEGWLTSKGRESATVVINSSASTVRTRTFGTNDKLAKSRAEEIKKVILSYYKDKGLQNRVKVEIESAKVQGPEYTGDFENQDKYGPFQYIELKTK